MKAALLEAFDAPLVIRDIDIAAPGPNEVLVRTAAVGLCHSDLHMMQGLRPVPLPLVLGHEVAGVVEAVGPNVTGLKAGDHVVGCLSVFCGHCPVCVSGHQVLCANPEVKMAPGVAKRLSMNGAPVAQNYNLSGFAEQMLVHQNALVKVRPDMPLDRAALLGCAVITGTGAVFRSARVEPAAPWPWWAAAAWACRPSTARSSTGPRASSRSTCWPTNWSWPRPLAPPT